MRVFLVLLLACALPLAGCSFIFVDGPSSSRPPMVYPSCDEERTMPAIDLVIAGLYGVAALVGATSGSEDNDFDGDDDRAEAVTGTLLGAVLFGGSAWYGFSKTGSCREARDQYRKQYGDPRLQPLPPMPYGYPAGEGQQCHPQAGCQPGLVCASGLCVRFQQPAQPPPPPGPPPPAGTQPAPPQPPPAPPPPGAAPPPAPWPPPPKSP